jgi:hypothetical protein
MRSPHSSVHFRISIALLCASLSLGCSKQDDGRPKVFPVAGKVFVGGKPAAKAEVMFHPLAADGALDTSKPASQLIRPFAVAEADGSFRPTSFLAGDGAPAGQYAITVSWPKYKMDAGEEVSGPDQLSGRYIDPKHPAQKVTIKESDNQLPVIDLK